MVGVLVESMDGLREAFEIADAMVFVKLWY